MNEFFHFALHRFAIQFDALQAEVDTLRRLPAKTTTNEIPKSRELKVEMKFAILDCTRVRSLPACLAFGLSPGAIRLKFSQNSRLRGEL